MRSATATVKVSLPPVLPGRRCAATVSARGGGTREREHGEESQMAQGRRWVAEEGSARLREDMSLEASPPPVLVEEARR
jgi:hypothetical protein